MAFAESSGTPDSLLLQGAWRATRFHIWGEWRAAARIEDGPTADWSDGDGLPRRADAETLRAALGELSADGLLTSVAEESFLRLWLPGANSSPAGGADERAGAPRWSIARVPTLGLRPADAIDLLSSLGPEPRQNCGDALRFWAGLASFVLRLIARQQFAPDLDGRGDGRFAAHWRLSVADENEIRWLERYVALMPPVCRSFAETDATSLEPTRIAEGFLAETADAIIRRSLSRDSFFDDIHERAAREGSWELAWISALLGEDRTMRGDVETLPDLAGQIHEWVMQQGEEPDENPPRLALELIEPEDSATEEGDSSWQLQLQLLSAEDGRPLDLQAVWNEPPAGPTILGRRLTTRREHLLAALHRAAGAYPPLRRLLGAASPTALTLSTAEAHAFLREAAPLLGAAGIEVDLPAWAGQSDRQLGLQLFLRPPGEGMDEVALGALGLGTLVDFDWRIAVGDEKLTPEEFERLAASKAPLVRLRGGWVGFDREAAERALAFMKRRAGGRMTLLEAIRLSGGMEDFDAGLPIVGLDGASWLEQFLRETPNTEARPIPQPEVFKGMLRPYQLRGLAWLAFLDRLGIGACLADDMGLGKTIQLIALLLHERVGGRPVGPTLLFAPMSVVGNWQREIERFSPSLRVLVFHGPLRLGGQAFLDAVQQSDVVITTYGLAHREVKSLSRLQWHRIALDEAQKVKNPSAHQTIALRSLTATHRLALTGTPIENHLSELWSIMEMLNPGLLGSAASFRANYAVPIEKLGDNERAARLSRMIRPFVLRRLKSDPAVVCDLPEKMEMRVFCNLTAEQAAYYQRTVADMLQEVERATGIRRRGLILATLTKLKQICNHPAHFLRQDGVLDGRSGKCERLVEMLEEVLEEGDAALVFTQYREMGDLLEKILHRRLRTEIPFLHGGTPMKKRNEMIDRFQDPASGVRIFLLSLKAGGFGLNLTKANHVFHFDRWWNPAVEQQATDRVHRIGQTRKVQVHKFVCIGTVEERIDKLLAEKSALADRIVGSGDEWLTGLSTQQLREYLALSDDAIADD